MRNIAPEEWKTYRVKPLKVYSGELKTYLLQGMELQFNGIKARMDGQEYVAPNLRGMVRSGDLVDVSEVVPTRVPTRSLVDRAIEAKQKSVKLLPDGWASRHWTSKCKFIESCEDSEMIRNIMRNESPKVQATARIRLEELEVAKQPAKVSSAMVGDLNEHEALGRLIGAEILPTGDPGTPDGGG